MFKKIICLLFFFIICCSSVYGLSISLTSPADDAKVNSPVDFKCKSNDDNLDKIDLWTNKSGNFIVDETDNSPSTGTDSTLTETFNGGNILWGCSVENGTDTAYSSNRTVVINIAPTQNITDRYIKEDTSNTTINLNSYTNDPDGDTLTFVITEEDNSKVDCNISGTGVLTVYGMNDYAGTTNCKINISDGYASLSKTMIIYITGLDDAPRLVASIPEQNFTNTEEHSFRLKNDYFFEPDGETLTFNLSVGVSNLNFSFNNEDVTITAASGWTGSVKVRINAYDPSRLTAQSNEFTINVFSGGATTTTTTLGNATTTTTSTTIASVGGATTTSTLKKTTLKTEGSNIGLIAGTSVSVLAILGALGFYYWKKKKSSGGVVEHDKPSDVVKQLPVQQPSKPDSGLLEPVIKYIRQCSDMGYPMSKIKSILLSKGWSKEQIDQAIRRMNK